MAGLPKGVLFIDRNRLEFFEEGQQQMVALQVPPTIMRDIEVTDKEGFSKLVNTFIDQNKLVPARIHIVIAHGLIFEKNFDIQKTESLDDEIKAFLDIVPFENVLSKKITLANIAKIVAINDDIMTSLKLIFETKGFKIESIIPHFELNANAPTQNSLSQKDLTLILSKFENIKQFSFIESPAYLGDEKEENEETNPLLAAFRGTGKKSKSLPILVVAFAVLVLILIFTLIRT